MQNSDQTINSEPEPEPEPEPVALNRHDRHYMPDGTLVIILNDTIFRVYGGLLGTRSSVFANMQNIPQPIEAVLVDGIPAVTLTGDSTEEFALLLDVLLGPVETADWVLSEVLGVLRVAHKYLFEEVITWGNRRLESYTPTWESMKTVFMEADGPYWDSWLALQVLQSAGQYPVPLAFEAVAFYCLTILMCRDPGDFINVANLDPLNLKRLLDGTRVLRSLVCKTIPNVKELSPPARKGACATCAGVRLSDSTGLMDKLFEDPLLALMDLHSWSGYLDDFSPEPRGFCPNCLESFRRNAGVLGRDLFNSLIEGKVFGGDLAGLTQ